MLRNKDTGASISAMSDNFWKDNFANNYKLLPANKNLNVYTGEKMPVLGMCEFMITYNNKKKCLCIFVIKNGGPPILGRDFMNLFGFAITQVNFAKRGTVTLKLKDESVTPKFIKARPLPYGMREKVEIELDNLVKLGVIKPVDYSPWATPIVPVIKKSGAIRICGDFKITLNPCLEIDQFPLPRIDDLFAKLQGGVIFSKIDLSQAYAQICLPLPRIDDLFAKLQGGVIFSKIDLSQAYAQICLDENSKCFTTISFQYQRLPYGVACAPAKFQKIMESVTQDIEGNSEHATTGVSPAFLMFGRHLTTRFSNLKPEVKQEIKNRVLHKQIIQSAYYGGKDTRKFRIGEKVIVKDYRQNTKSTWILGNGNVTPIKFVKLNFKVNIPELNRKWKRHTNQIRKTKLQSGLIDHEISTEFGETTNSDNPNEVVSKEIEIALLSLVKLRIPIILMKLYQKKLK
ncbi:hypothetical protein QE152_g20797 [Popillia japonica]|uniref:Reverse transcriptase domain-containing protein n=1 Tax=Popillia japonica TaxID=7064 RepID=A0AAW1KN69_POPJA